ncbi:MAG: FHA domain-containing protein [Deltaproteobacteria bacterium]|jgi:hypothetical protein|nr:FHA domain-containing protein [Deltaproteobacteria bacterium]
MGFEVTVGNGEEKKVRICGQGHENPFDAPLCLVCSEDISANPEVTREPGVVLDPPPKLITLREGSSPEPAAGETGVAVGTEAGAGEGADPLEMVRVCGQGHISPFDAVICVNPECGEDIALNPIMSRERALNSLKAPPAAPSSAPPAALAGSPPAVAAAGSSGVYFLESPLVFQGPGGATFEAQNGEIVGRQEVGSACLQEFPTVSRRHFQVFFQEGRWLLKNFSDNGTWVNDELVPVGQEKEINSGDALKLSSRCRLTVISA